MALLERLQILVDGNASGAIREFQKVGAAADRELGRTEDKLQRLSGQLTSFGTGLVAGSAVAAVGLSKLATAASDYGEAVNKATVIIGGESVRRLEDFAETASKTAGIGKTAALDAAAGFAALGKQAGLTGDPLANFSTDLVQLAGDLASFNNTTVDESLQALKSGLQGETEPLKRYNIFLNDAALKQEFLSLTGEKVTGTLTAQQKVVAANSLIFKQASDATGDFERTSDSLANRQRALQADFENLKTELGEGLVPVFETVIGAIGGVVGKFAELPDGVQKPLGTLAGIGTVAAGAVGGLSLIAGQVINLRDAFTTLDEDGNRSLTNLGRGVKIAGAAVGGAGLAIAFLQIADAANQASIDLVQVETALNQFSRATDPRQVAKDFQDLATSLEGGVDEAGRRLSELLGRDQSAVLVGPEKLRVTLQNADRALEELFKRRDTENLRRALDLLGDAEFVAATDLYGAISIPSEDEARFQATLDRFRGYLGSMGTDADKASGQVEDFGAAQLNAAGATEEAANTYDKVQGYLDDYADKIAILTVNYDALSERASAFTDAIERSTTLDDEISAARSLGDAFTGLRENIGALPAELDLATLAFGGYNEEQRKAIDALLAAGDQSSQFLQTLIEQGRTTDEIRFGAALLREEYKKQLEQLGFNEEQVQNYLTVLGLTPEQVNTAITLSGEEEARFKIEAYQALIEGTPAERLTGFYAEIAAGNYEAAAAQLDDLARERTATITIQQRIAESQTVPGSIKQSQDAYAFLAWAALGGNKEAADALNALAGAGAAGAGGAGWTPKKKMAKGGPVMAGQQYLVGEEGPEMFVPRTSGTIVPNGQLQGGTVNLTQNITTGDPILTAAEVVRRQRDAEFLAGV
jgi:hypothetical protein